MPRPPIRLLHYACRPAAGPKIMPLMVASPALQAAVRCCSTEAPPPPPPPRRGGSGRRRRAVSDDVDDDDTEALLRDEDSVGSTKSSLAVGHIEPLVLRHMDERGGGSRIDSDMDDDEEDGGIDDGPGRGESTPVDPLLVQSTEADLQGRNHSTLSAEVRAPSSASPLGDPVKEYLAFHHDMLDAKNNRCLSIPIAELVDLIKAYQAATENPRNVSSKEEAFMFPALFHRLQECSVGMLLDVVEMHWARSTLVRHGTLFKDVVRDRVAQVAAELTPEEVLRSIIVMGMSAGRRKRDLDFFQVLGRLFMVHVNAFRNPTDLVRVLTAFARAKIVPPPSFLALMGRRLQVLCKNQPLPSLPAYRAFVNLHKMGYDNMNAYRFLADRIAECMEESVKQEKTRVRVKELLSQRMAEAARHAQNATTESGDGPAGEQQEAATEPKEDSAAPQFVGGDLVQEMGATLSAKRRFSLLTGGLKPSHVTKLLLVLGRFGAPHQQYLRPISKALLIPHMKQLPPPGFTRLLRAMRFFKTTDVALVTAVIDRLITLGPAEALLPDLLEALRLLSLPDVPVVPNLPPFISLCASVFGQQARLRAGDMCAVANDLMHIQRKEDIPLDAVAELCGLMDIFAERMTFLMHLGVLALPHAEALEELCKQMHHPDTQRKVQELSEARRQINQRDGGDDEYYMSIDIDVRETFHKAQIFNNWNTFGSFRPLPGVLQVDFQHALTEVSAECILETAHLFELAYPGRMIAPLERTMTKAFLAKLSDDGEWVVSPEDPTLLTARKNEEILFTRDSLKKFQNLILATPLKGLRRSPLVWSLVYKKSQRLQMGDVAALAEKQLRSFVIADVVGGAGAESREAFA